MNKNGGNDGSDRWSRNGRARENEKRKHYYDKNITMNFYVFLTTNCTLTAFFLIKTHIVAHIKPYIVFITLIYTPQ